MNFKRPEGNTSVYSESTTIVQDIRIGLGPSRTLADPIPSVSMKEVSDIGYKPIYPANSFWTQTSIDKNQTLLCAHT